MRRTSPVLCCASLNSSRTMTRGWPTWLPSQSSIAAPAHDDDPELTRVSSSVELLQELRAAHRADRPIEQDQTRPGKGRVGEERQSFSAAASCEGVPPSALDGVGHGLADVQVVIDHEYGLVPIGPCATCH